MAGSDRCGSGGVVKITVLICESTYRELTDLAPKITGRYGRALSRVVDEALKEYLEKRRRELGIRIELAP